MLQVGDKVKWEGKTKMPEWYYKLTSNGVVLKVRNKKAFVHWQDGVVDRWHWLHCLVKL